MADGSRLDPTDRIPQERRHKPRREEDRVRIEALRNRYAMTRRIALRATAAWALVATVGMVALYLQGQHSAASSKDAARSAAKSERAIISSASANAKSERAIVLLEGVAAGECYRVNYLRWNVDKGRYADWLRDRRAATFLGNVRRPTTGTRALATSFANAASATYFLPLTNCRAADAHPTTYVAPRAVPFEKADPKVVARTLANSPKPPASSP